MVVQKDFYDFVFESNNVSIKGKNKLKLIIEFIVRNGMFCRSGDFWVRLF